MVKPVTDSAILKKARKLVETDMETFLCNAIGRAAGRRHVTRGNSLIEWVKKMLGDHPYYSRWLVDNHWRFAEENLAQVHRNGRRGSTWKEGRLQWLDWMIAECEKAEAANG